MRLECDWRSSQVCQWIRDIANSSGVGPSWDDRLVTRPWARPGRDGGKPTIRDRATSQWKSIEAAKRLAVRTYGRRDAPDPFPGNPSAQTRGSLGSCARTRIVERN